MAKGHHSEGFRALVEERRLAATIESSDLDRSLVVLTRQLRLHRTGEGEALRRRIEHARDRFKAYATQLQLDLEDGSWPYVNPESPDWLDLEETVREILRLEADLDETGAALGVAS